MHPYGNVAKLPFGLCFARNQPALVGYRARARCYYSGFKEVEKVKLNWKKLGLFGIAAFLILPTGTPDDLFISLPLIAYLGLEVYLMVATVALFVLWDKLR